jgi:hypothetical protein
MEIMMASTIESNCVQEVPRAERIARLNDELRIKARGGQVFISNGVQQLTGAHVAGLLQALAGFSDFDADSDPHGERDFGLFDFCGRELMFKIDYYSSAELRWGSNDPADANATHRVLTVLLAEEY